MMHIFNGDALVAEFVGGPSLASWLIAHPDTHDYEPDGRIFRLKFREPWRLVTWPAR